MQVQTTNQHFIIQLDKNMISPEVLFKLLEALRIEQLAQIVAMDDSIEELGQEIKQNWWQANKDRLLNTSK
jgi:F0F1-type ATP synthase gamma subunit